MQNDIVLLKAAWANLAEKEVTDSELVIPVQKSTLIPLDIAARNLTGKLPAEAIVSKDADDVIHYVDEQGFQLVTSKSSKKAEKKAITQRTLKSKPYITRSKVGAPKHFR